MQIRPVTLSDIDEFAAPLSELGAATFTDSFGHLYPPNDLSSFVAKNHSVEAYRRNISDPDHYHWIAHNDDHLTGYLTMGPNSLPCDPPVPSAVELNRLYILKSCQNLGLGQKLLNQAVSTAQGLGFNNMVLSVWSENFGGHRFYRRNGFEKIGEYKFPVGDHLDDEWIMRKRL